MSWRDLLRPASFRGAFFRVDTTSKAGGRRGQTFEYPKRDQPSSEDLGARAKRWTVTGWVIGEDYVFQADALEVALSAEGASLLVHPIMGEMSVRCEVWTRSERRTEGGMATFDMVFTEAGQSMTAFVMMATDIKVTEKATEARAAAVQSFDSAAVNA